MTPAARYAAAIEVLDLWRDGMPVTQALKAWARGARYAGSKDRAAVQDHVYDALRCKGSAAQAGGGETGRALILGLLRMQGVDPATVFTGEGHAPSPLAGPELHAPAPAPDAMADIPDWLRPLFQDSLGDTTHTVLQQFQQRAPVYLRVNSRKSDRSSAQAALAADGVVTAPCAQAPMALEVMEGARKLRNAAAYLDGRVELQDLSVQCATDWVPWPEQGPILDFCAGGGGKTLALAVRLGAEICAHDALPRRMADLPTRAERAGAQVRIVPTKGVDNSGPYTAVLCDVPCSGSGTWRRDPEAKWRLTPARLEELTATQSAILDRAARLVGEDGLLVYMTCSLFHAENDAQLARFCDAHPEWRVTARRLETPMTASDGFFAAVLTRSAAVDAKT